MTRPIGTFHDVETGEVIVREFNDEEFAQWELDKAAEQAEARADAKKEADKAAILKRLGISADDVQLLLG